MSGLRRKAKRAYQIRQPIPEMEISDAFRTANATDLQTIVDKGYFNLSPPGLDGQSKISPTALTLPDIAAMTRQIEELEASDPDALDLLHLLHMSPEELAEEHGLEFSPEFTQRLAAISHLPKIEQAKILAAEHREGERRVTP